MAAYDERIDPGGGFFHARSPKITVHGSDPHLAECVHHMTGVGENLDVSHQAIPELENPGGGNILEGSSDAASAHHAEDDHGLARRTDLHWLDGQLLPML